MSNEMIITVCDKGHRIRNTGSIKKFHVKEHEKDKKFENHPQVLGYCPRCLGKIVQKIEV